MLPTPIHTLDRRRPWPGFALLTALLSALSAAGPASAGGRDLRDFTPSQQLSAGEVEIQTFHNVYTQTEFFDDDGKRRDAGGRSTYYTGTFSFTSGWRPRFNPGIDLTLRHVTDETFPAGNDSRTRLTAVTPRLEWAPFRRFPAVSWETGLRIPLSSDLEGRSGDPFLDWDDLIWTNRIFFDVRFGPETWAYLESGAQVRFDDDQNDIQITTPVKAIVNANVSRRWSVYVPLDVSPDWVGSARGNFYSQAGAGLKYRPVGWLELEALATWFPFGRNAGAGRTFNLGLRTVR